MPDGGASDSLVAWASLILSAGIGVWKVFEKARLAKEVERLKAELQRAVLEAEQAILNDYKVLPTLLRLLAEQHLRLTVAAYPLVRPCPPPGASRSLVLAELHNLLAAEAPPDAWEFYQAHVEPDLPGLDHERAWAEVARWAQERLIHESSKRLSVEWIALQATVAPELIPSFEEVIEAMAKATRTFLDGRRATQDQQPAPNGLAAQANAANDALKRLSKAVSEHLRRVAAP